MDSSIRELSHLVREKGIIGAVCRQYLLWWTLQDKWVRCGQLDCCSQVSLSSSPGDCAPPPPGHPLSRGTIKGVSHLSGSRSRKERKGRSRRLGMSRVAK